MASLARLIVRVIVQACGSKVKAIAKFKRVRERERVFLIIIILTDNQTFPGSCM